MKVGVFDSGIGGLTILKALIDKYPHHEYIYYGDTIHVPYGIKTKDEIIKYANNIINFLEKNGVSIIVIACGTVSSNIKYLDSNVKLIDVLSPLNNKLDKYKCVSIIATPLSIRLNKFKEYIHTDLNLISAPSLVPIIESNDYKDLDNVLKDYLKSTNKSDALLLGCTHYPIIKEYIEKYYKNDIITLDMYLLDIFKDFEDGNSSLKLYFSYLNDNIIANVKKILNKENIEIEEILC